MHSNSPSNQAHLIFSNNFIKLPQQISKYLIRWCYNLLFVS
uniref:Uncharacterized protein n=1 Tax=Anguilla anguilla TaxID=7936 RepID=A0A0E9QM10_ANGAN